MVALAILIFIALRAARVTNESGGNIAAKILTSIFGVFVAFFNLQLAGWRVLFDTNTAARLAEIQESGVELSIQGQAWLQNSGIKSSDFLMNPLMFAGNWVPEMVEISGGKDLFGRIGMHSDWSTYDILFKYDPEKIILMPCGLTINQTLEEMGSMTNVPNWKSLKAVKTENVFITDGNKYFNRPGPRILDSIKILIEIVSNQKADFGYKKKGWEKFSN